MRVELSIGTPFVSRLTNAMHMEDSPGFRESRLLLEDIDQLQRSAQHLLNEFDFIYAQFNQSLSDREAALRRRRAIIDSIDQNGR